MLLYEQMVREVSTPDTQIVICERHPLIDILIYDQKMSRCPMFVFGKPDDAAMFYNWLPAQFHVVKKEAEKHLGKMLEGINQYAD